MSYFDINDYIIHNNAIQTLRKWIRDFEKGVPNTPETAIIYGPPGSGKTTLVNSILKHFGYDIIEFVPDHTKTHKLEMKRLEDILNGKNIMMMINFEKKGVFFDDIDIGSSGDRGFISDIVTLLDGKRKKKKKRNRNPLILTMNSKITNKKTVAINKSSIVIYINRLNPHELFSIGKRIIEKLSKKDFIDDNELIQISNTCQGDIRNIYQKIEGRNAIQEQKQHTKITNIYGSKDLEIKCLPTLQRYSNPDIDLQHSDLYNLYFNDPLFIPAFVYENSYEVVNKVHFKNKKKVISYYHKILDSLTSWCLFDGVFNNNYFSYNIHYNVYNGVVIPLHYIRYIRKKYSWQSHTFKTSNLYSRISQSSFNSRSLCELSNQLNISKNEYHLFTYILHKLLELENSELSKSLVKFLESKGILSADIDRIFRYNCLSKEIDKVLTSKKRSQIRKMLNSLKN